MDLSNENVIHIKKDKIEYLQFRKLLEYDDIINHAYTLGKDVSFRTYSHGITPLPKEQLDNVLNNFKNICRNLGTDYSHVIQSDQEHTKNIAIVNDKINKDLPDVNLENYLATDGFITNKPNLMLSTTNADCILLLFFDPIKKVIANVHSGWKGTLKEISVEAVNKMEKEFGSDVKDIICCICPSIRKCHFEVEEDVKNLFYEKYKNLKEIDDIIVKQNNQDKWNIDTVLINKIILLNKGLKKDNIIDSKICSVCNSDLIHSFRVEKEGYGLDTALIELKGG